MMLLSVLSFLEIVILFVNKDKDTTRRSSQIDFAAARLRVVFKPRFAAGPKDANAPSNFSFLIFLSNSIHVLK